MGRLTLAHLVHNELTRFEPLYASRCTEHAALAAYPTLASLVVRLIDPEKNKSKPARCERSKLLCEIISAYQPAHDRLWGAVLVAAFRPLLASKRLYGADPEEREALFFAALTEVVDKLDVRRKPEQVHAIVWLTAKKALVRKLEKQKAWSDVGFGDEADLTPDRTSWLPEPLLAAWLLSRGRGAEGRPDLDLVVQVAEWGSLKAYVDAEHATLSSAERSRVYERLQKRHRRAIAQLRETLAEPPEQPGPRDSVPPPDSKTRLLADAALTEKVAVDAPVTCDQQDCVDGDVTRDQHGDADRAVTRDQHGDADCAVTRDRHGDADGAVTRDTLEHARCDRRARAPSERTDFDDTDRGESVAFGTLATPATAREALS